MVRAIVFEAVIQPQKPTTEPTQGSCSQWIEKCLPIRDQFSSGAGSRSPTDIDQIPVTTVDLLDRPGCRLKHRWMIRIQQHAYKKNGAMDLQS